MKNIENLIVEFVRNIDFNSLMCFVFLLLFLFLPIYNIILKIKEEKDKEEKKFLKIFTTFLLFLYIGLVSMTVKYYFDKKNTTIEKLNNENNIFLQEKNNNIEVYYISKINDIKTEDNIFERASLKITIQQIGEENYYIYFDNEKNQKKEVRKEEIKDFINNIKKQENYKGTAKHEKLTLKDFE